MPNTELYQNIVDQMTQEQKEALLFYPEDGSSKAGRPPAPLSKRFVVFDKNHAFKLTLLGLECRKLIK